MNRLVQVLGDEDAATLMQHLPPSPGSETATKGDIAALREAVDRGLAGVAAVLNETTASHHVRFEEIDQRFEEIDQRFETLDRRLAQVDSRLDRLEIRLDRLEGRFERLEERLSDTREALRRDIYELSNDFQAEVRAQTRMFALTILGSAATLAAGVVGAAFAL